MKYHIGQHIKGQVTGVQPYGVFILLDEQTKTQGLIHISECQQGFVKDLENQFKIGDVIEVIILDIDEFTQKISLSIRALAPIGEDLGIRKKKRYWTNKRADIGFSSIKEQLEKWVDEALKDFITVK